MKITSIAKRKIIEPIFSKLGIWWNYSQIVASKEKWKRSSQEGEFKFHSENKWRQTPQFIEQTELLFRGFDFHEDDFIGKTIVDLGAAVSLGLNFLKA